MVAAGEENTYDFMFIDADKPNYDAYYELGLKLVRPKGIIAVDNVSEPLQLRPAYIAIG